MNIINSIVTKNPCYTAGRKITVKGLMLHSVGCPQPNASVFVNQFNNASYTRACVHGFIDANTGNIHQTLPWEHRGWHGGGSSNDTHIGVEMCEPNCIKYTTGSNFTCSDTKTAKAMVKRTYDAAVELFAFLCKEYKLDPMQKGVIVSHKEGCALGIASNHGDPEHLWNGLGMGYTMDTFRNDVKKKMNSSNKAASTTASTAHANSFVVRITAKTLYIRQGAGLNYKTNGVVKKDEAYTIVETKGNWYKLKSGAGWISSKYCKKV